MSQKNNRWPELGLVTKNVVKDKDGNPVKDSKGQDITRLGFKLNDEVYEVLKKAGFNISQYGTLTSPVEEVERLIKNGAIEEKDVESRRESAKQAHTWLRYKVQLPPPRDA